jgi:hypothetical protein
VDHGQANKVLDGNISTGAVLETPESAILG